MSQPASALPSPNDAAAFYSHVAACKRARGDLAGARDYAARATESEARRAAVAIVLDPIETVWLDVADQATALAATEPRHSVRSTWLRVAQTQREMVAASTARRGRVSA